jgi:hypothetical protein
MLEVVSALEEAGAGPTAAIQAYATQHGVPPREALDALAREARNGREFAPEENMLSLACVLNEAGIYSVEAWENGFELEVVEKQDGRRVVKPLSETRRGS